MVFSERLRSSPTSSTVNTDEGDDSHRGEYQSVVEDTAEAPSPPAQPVARPLIDMEAFGVREDEAAGFGGAVQALFDMDAFGVGQQQQQLQEEEEEEEGAGSGGATQPLADVEEEGSGVQGPQQGAGGEDGEEEEEDGAGAGALWVGGGLPNGVAHHPLVQNQDGDGWGAGAGWLRGVGGGIPNGLTNGLGHHHPDQESDDE